KQDKTYTSQKYKTGEVYIYESTSDGIKFKKGDTVKYYLVKNADANNTTEYVTVPDTYIGYTEENFVKAIEALGLKASKQDKTYTSQKYKTGEVYIYDSTSDGIKFKKGDTVKYYLVKNADSNNTTEYVTVPDSYIGYTEENFRKAIEALGLKPVKQDKTYTSQKYKTGEVYIYDSTSDGIKFKKGDSVKYYLVKNNDSTEKPNDTPVVQTKITLANQVGQSKDSANSYCTNNGLKAAFNETYSSTVAAGTIISMSPAAGSQVDKNSTVTFTVSKGAEPAKTAKILSSNTIIQFYSKNSYEETETAVKKYLSDAGFTNVSCVKPTITDENKNKFYNLNKGVVVSVSVGGNTDYTAGEYPVNTAIVVTILDKEIN
ncbi:MAG: PASTA domain-containing protein, partial [Erysipelotrichaceae bacterium]|nr:PASTA domain-containing protein [Erysipelotrichaceae bacterium]